MIEQFQKEYRWLSNFSQVEIMLDGIEYPSVEHAYMSAKSDDPEWKKFCSNPINKPGLVKQESKKIKLVEDWDKIKISIMKICLDQKFRTQPYKSQLLKTGYEKIQEGNYHGDKFWGVDLKTGIGRNVLGTMIMEIRREIRDYED